MIIIKHLLYEKCCSTHNGKYKKLIKNHVMKKHIFKGRKISIYLISIYLIAEITGDMCITTKEEKI